MSMISYSMTIVDNDQFISSGKVFKLLFLPGIYAKIMHHFFLEIVTSTHIVLDTLVLNFGSLLVIDSCPINISSLSCLFYLSILCTYFQLRQQADSDLRVEYAVINIGLVRLTLPQLPKVTRGAAKQQIKKITRKDGKKPLKQYVEILLVDGHFPERRPICSVFQFDIGVFMFGDRLQISVLSSRANYN